LKTKKKKRKKEEGWFIGWFMRWLSHPMAKKKKKNCSRFLALGGSSATSNPRPIKSHPLTKMGVAGQEPPLLFFFFFFIFFSIFLINF
jgi:hypothetical protein